VLPAARTVIVTGTIYNTNRPDRGADPDRAHIARYAWGDDYHDVITAMARRVDESRTPSRSAAARDTGLGERVYAAWHRWIGKNTHQPRPRSRIFAEIICSRRSTAMGPPSINAPHAVSRPARRTRSSRRVSDSTRCISHFTIELKGDAPAALAGDGTTSTAATSARKSVRGMPRRPCRTIRPGSRGPTGTP
jgi:epoxyqueuosine reductase